MVGQIVRFSELDRVGFPVKVAFWETCTAEVDRAGWEEFCSDPQRCDTTAEILSYREYIHNGVEFTYDEREYLASTGRCPFCGALDCCQINEIDNNLYTHCKPAEVITDHADRRIVDNSSKPYLIEYAKNSGICPWCGCDSVRYYKTDFLDSDQDIDCPEGYCEMVFKNLLTGNKIPCGWNGMMFPVTSEERAIIDAEFGR